MTKIIVIKIMETMTIMMIILCGRSGEALEELERMLN
jgi:hypothetical protein